MPVKFVENTLTQVLRLLRRTPVKAFRKDKKYEKIGKLLHQICNSKQCKHLREPAPVTPKIPKAKGKLGVSDLVSRSPADSDCDTSSGTCPPSQSDAGPGSVDSGHGSPRSVQSSCSSETGQGTSTDLCSPDASLDSSSSSGTDLGASEWPWSNGRDETRPSSTRDPASSDKTITTTRSKRDKVILSSPSPKSSPPRPKTKPKPVRN